jgi:hypothetical protein
MGLQQLIAYGASDWYFRAGQALETSSVVERLMRMPASRSLALSNRIDGLMRAHAACDRAEGCPWQTAYRLYPTVGLCALGPTDTLLNTLLDRAVRSTLQNRRKRQLRMFLSAWRRRAARSRRCRRTCNGSSCASPGLRACNVELIAALPHCRIAALPHCRIAALPHCLSDERAGVWTLF